MKTGNVYNISGKMKIAANRNVKARDYWLNKLAGSPVKSFFPYNPKETTGDKRHFDTVNFQLRGELFSNLMHLSNKSDNRLSMIFAAGLVTLLHKYTGNNDIIIGMPVHKQKVEGEFINRVLPLRNKPEPGMTFKQLLLEVRKTVSEAVEHQNYPIEILVYKLNLPSSEEGKGIDLFDAAILLENIHDENYLDRFNYNMLFSFLRTDESIDAALKYTAFLYEKNTAERIAGHFQQLFQVVLSDLDIRLADIDILPEEEKRQILVDFNDTHAAYPTDKTIHEMLAAQVDKTPDKTALIYRDQYLTYRGLNEKANRLARLLRDRGIKPNEIVAILLRPSLELIVAIAGILKAGGAYLPIDPVYPAKRIASVLKNTNASILLGSQNTINAIAENDKDPLANTPEVLLLDQVWADLGHYPEINPDHVNQPGDLFYMISTSGSTGTPKSFMMEHRNLVNLFYFEFLETPVEFKRVLQFASIGFDVSIQEIFSTLLSGGELYLIDSETKQDVYRLLELIQKNYLNVLFCPPAFLKYIFSEPDYRARFPKSIEHIIAAGEQLIITGPIRRYMKENHIYLHNHYGPGETHLVTTFVIDPTADIPERVPIGKPISNSRVYILDENKNIKPIGIYGELYISGVNVGRGYHRREDLNAEKFLPDPFVEGARMYRSGDLGRWLSDGNIEFIGRADYQVKIRGFRIELGEIESRLMNIDGIREVVVVDYEDPAGEKSLCAYIVSEKEVDIMEIKDTLAGDLPDYMIPAYFVPMEKIPLNPSGKVDRRALPAPKLEKGKTYAAPRDKVEEELAGIWSQVLGLDKGDIGIDADFFDLGGHSLKATILISRIHKSFNASLSLGEMFNQPSIRGLSELIKGRGGDIFAAIQPIEKREYYPMSSAQKRIYILQQMNVENISYNNPAFVTLEGNLREDKFEQTLKELIGRHETLRTSFAMINREPMQRVHDDVEFDVDYFDLAAKNAKDREEIVKNFIKAFDLSKAPLLRVELIKTGEKQHTVMYDMHHIITDGTSMQVFIREFLALYGGNRLPALRVRYKDFSEWQNRLFESGEVRKQQEYWLSQLAGEIPVLDIPTDYPRPEIQRFEGDTVRFEIGSDTTRALNELAKKQGVTLYMLLLAIYNVLLSRLSGQEDIITGNSIAGRRHVDLHFIIGMFVNTLVMRNYPAGQKTFNRFLDEVKERTLAAFENQEYPFDELVDRIAVKRDTGRNPLFDVMFVLQNIAVQSGTIPEVQIPELKIAPYQPETQSTLRASKFDMTLMAVEAGDRLLFTYEYCTSLFKRETIERFITYFKRLAADIRENPDKKISGIEIISEEEKNRLLIEFNQTEFDYPGDKTIHELFEEQVERTPENIALHGCMNAWMHEGGHIAYRELNKRANQMANVLKEKGVLADSIIGIMIERSIEMIIAILGILKAGGAYLPIEPGYPRERIDYMLKDSGAKLLVTTDNLEAPGFPLLPAAGHRPPATSLAYVIYTSGSTGRPKGVMVEHPSVVNILSALQAAYPLNKPDTYLFKTSYIFDVSAAELFGWFRSGGRLAVLEAGAEKDPNKIIETIERQCVTHINFVPSMFSVFVEHVTQPGRENIARLSGLKYIFLAGEALLPELVEGFRRLNTGITAENIYGPTEAAIYSSWYSLAHWDGKGGVPIGKPMPNIRLYIMDKTGGLQPIGIPGELCIAGAGIARGYLNNPELTAEKFVRSVISHSSFVISSSEFSTNDRCPMTNDRLYRTGDLARWLADGNIEFLGRMDHQVKIRGFRIETGEIESRLLKHPGVKEAVAVDREMGKGDKYLCAYIVPGSAGIFDSAPAMETELKDYLSASLPDYMIPTRFVRVEKIPLIPSGKVDRKSLPEPEIKPGETYAVPRDDIEERLAVLWSEVLALDKKIIGIDANFFDLGGHSLKAIILITGVHKAFNVKLTLLDLFRKPTIRRLAAVIKEAGGDIFAPIEPIEKKEYYPLSSAQKRIYILQRMEANNISYNNPAFVTLEGDLRVDRFEETLQELIKRHESLRTSFEMLNREPVQRVHEDVEFDVNYSDLAAKNAKDREEIVKNFIRAFDLSKAPLLRVELIKTGEKQYIVMYDMHHIITDGTSIQLFIREFLALYAGNRLPALRVRYKDFSEWRNRLFESGEVRKQQEYWLNRFAGEIPLLNIPTDYPRPEIQRFEGNRISFEIGNDTTRALNELAKKQGVTLYMLLLAVYNVLLSRLSGQEDIIIGNSTAGRRHADLHFIIGMFVNTLVMRNYPAGQKTFKQFLDEVKESTLAAFENQDYPFDELVDQIALNRDTGRNPLFDVMFVLQNIAVQSGTIPEVQIPGLKIAPYRPGTQPTLNVSKFDMTLTAVEAGDRLLFTYEYCTALFKKETIERFITYFKRLAADIRENPDKKISEIEIISEVEKNLLLVEFNQTEFAYPKDKTIHELFEMQAEQTPDRVTLVGAAPRGCPTPGQHQMTYRELDERSGRLACLLKEKGVLTDSIIGIMIERSVEMIIGTLGILKAGGAYLPIEPGYPRERIDYILKDSGARLSVTTDNLGAPDFPLLPAAGHRQPATSLAYVIYTSGSTGRPKGVGVEHRSLVNAVTWQSRFYEITGRDHTTQYASAGFDASVLEIFPCLVRGAALHIIDEETRLEPGKLNRYFEKHNITFSFLPTRVCEQFMELENRSLRVLLAAGDKLRLFIKRSYRLYNNYGPTENTVVAAAFAVDKHYPDIPIGKPIHNNCIFILNAHDLKLQPIGVVGELCIGGDSLSRGYLNNPELTAEKFRRAVISHLSLVINSSKSTNDQCPMTNDRLYRTGDLARWLPDGNIEFTGRIDQQVKIRGSRIEAGEIENRLRAHESVKSALVIAREQKGEKYLCAYIITQKPCDLSQLKDFLSISVPGYMVPAYFVEIAEIPLTPSGKVDRKALPEPGIISGAAYVPPGDDVEERLVNIWADVLEVDKGKIGIEDDFFKIGGHSLKAAAVISTIQKEFNVDVPLVEIFRSPTIKQLARTLRENESESFLLRDENLTLLKKQDRDARHLFLVHDGSGEVEGYIEFCRYLNIDFNCWGIRAYAGRNENYGPKNLTIGDTAAAYIGKIKNLQPTGPYFIAGWSLGGTIAFEMVNQLEQKGEDVGFFALIDSPPPRQANAMIDIQRFTFDTEKKFVSRYLPQREIEKIAGNVEGIDDFWAYITAYLEAEPFDVQSIRQVVMEYEAHVVPNYHGLEIKQLVKYLNTGRTFRNARANYTPARKIHTPVHYFAASQSKEIIVKEYWNDHCREPVRTYEIPGDHYSIFRKPDVLHFAAFFGKTLV